MKNIINTTIPLLLLSAAAHAGGIDRSGQGLAILWEKGEVATLSFGDLAVDVNSANSLFAGDVGQDFGQFSLSYKKPLTDELSAAMILDQPFGAGIAYPAGPLAGTRAELRSLAITGLLHYRMPSNVSIYGGLRAHRLAGDASVPLVGGYTLSTEDDWGLGYVAGVAYERPDIALRVALTYNSEIDHTLDSTEFGMPFSFDNTTPQSLNLDFQTGVAEGTLVFGSVRWVDWSEYDVTPAAYPLGSLVEYSNDVITYTLGVGRRFNERWSGALSFSYEPQDGEVQPNLSPTDGYRSVSLAAIYTIDEKTKITTGLRYVDIGDATSRAGIPFEDSSAIGFGVSLTHQF